MSTIVPPDITATPVTLSATGATGATGTANYVGLQRPFLVRLLPNTKLGRPVVKV